MLALKDPTQMKLIMEQEQQHYVPRTVVNSLQMVSYVVQDQLLLKSLLYTRPCSCDFVGNAY